MFEGILLQGASGRLDWDLQSRAWVKDGRQQVEVKRGRFTLDEMRNVSPSSTGAGCPEAAHLHAQTFSGPSWALHEADVGPEIFRILSNMNDPMNLQALAHPACPVTVLQRLAGS